MDRTEISHNYSSLQFNIDDKLSKEIIDFGYSHIIYDYLYMGENDDCGRDLDPHCTILYGIISSEAKEIRPIISKIEPFKVRFGKISFFENDNCDVMKIEIESERLRELNSLLKRRIDFENHFPKYIAHCTIAYIKKGIKENLSFDSSYFEGKEMEVRTCEFSSKDGSREIIKFK